MNKNHSVLPIPPKLLDLDTAASIAGMARTRFDEEIRPYLDEVLGEGKQRGVLIKSCQLDEVLDWYASAHVVKLAKPLPIESIECPKNPSTAKPEPPVSISTRKRRYTNLTRKSGESEFAAAVAQAQSRKQN